MRILLESGVMITLRSYLTAFLGLALLAGCGPVRNPEDVAVDFKPSASKVFAYTSFTEETQSIMQQLQCKWGGMSGPYDRQRYDFLCQGGAWGTVMLLLDKSPQPNAISRVRLIWKEWDTRVNPAAAEAYEAAKFLNYVLAHYVSPKDIKKVQDTFWQYANKSYNLNGVKLDYRALQDKKYIIHRLELTGNSKAIPMPEQGYIYAIPPEPTKVPKSSPSAPATLPVTQQQTPAPARTYEEYKAPALEHQVTAPAVVPQKPAKAQPITKQDIQWFNDKDDGTRLPDNPSTFDGIDAYQRAIELTEPYTSVGTPTTLPVPATLETVAPGVAPRTEKPQPKAPAEIKMERAPSLPPVSPDLQRMLNEEKLLLDEAYEESVPPDLRVNESAIPPAKPLNEQEQPKDNKKKKENQL